MSEQPLHDDPSAAFAAEFDDPAFAAPPAHLPASTERYLPMPRADRDDPAWREPLRLAERALRALPPSVGDDLFALGDFEIMGRVESAAHPPLVLYKHRRMRTHLNLDPSGRPYRFLAAQRFEYFGTYRPHDSLRAAVDDLELAEMGRLLRRRGRGRRATAPPGTSAA